MENLTQLICKKSFKTSNKVRYVKGQIYKVEAINYQIGGTQIFRVTHNTLGVSFVTIPQVMNKFFVNFVNPYES